MTCCRPDVFVCVAVLACGAAFSGCSKGPSPPPAAAAPATAATPPAASSSSGSVLGRIADAPSGVPVIVVLDPKTPHEFPPPGERPVMDQVSQTFGPALLFVRTNTPTDFRNSDDTLHNVHVTHEDTKEPQFNVAIPTGETYTFTFKRTGFYHVGCDIHPAMSAEIFASSSPFVAVAEQDGSFRLDDVPPGQYVATVYAGSRKMTKDVDVAPGSMNVTIS